MEKDQIIELCIEDMLDDGRAFGRYEGCAVFISGGAADNSGNKMAGAIPGDIVRARVTKSKKSSAEAVLTAIVNSSPDRTEAECPYFGECGGCTLQEIAYEAQKELKKGQVRAKLERLGGIKEPKVNDCIGADSLKYYRNKAAFAVGPHGEVGFLKSGSHFVIDIEDCMLQSDAAMVCADALRTFLKEHSEVQNGDAPLSGMTVKTAFGTGEVMVVLEIGSLEKKKDGRKVRRTSRKNSGSASSGTDIPEIETLVSMLDDAVYSLGCDENGDPSDEAAAFSLESVAVISGNKCRIAAGKPTITEEVITDDGRSIMIEISPQSFYQVNPEQMVKLYDKAAEYAGIPDRLPNNGETTAGADEPLTVLDLYCGVGTIGIWLADMARAKGIEMNVIGIESVKPAVIDANRNSVINGLVNTRYICGKAEEELPGMMGLTKLYKWNEVNERVERVPEIQIVNKDEADGGAEADKPGTQMKISRVHAAVLDPPRAGCGEALLAAVAAAQPDRIVYVSCDPGTLARDIRYLTGHGYEFIEATPVDQFPWTSHIEVVAKIQRR